MLSEIVAEGLVCAVTSMYKLCADIIKACYAHTWRILKRALRLAQKGCVISETSPAILNMTSLFHGIYVSDGASSQTNKD